MRRSGLACFLAMGLAASPGPALADGRGTNDKDRSALARKAFADGKKAYNVGDFDQAIDLWKQAYEYRDDPNFLFNIAQAYRQKGDVPKALFFYRAYVREAPRARNRPEVEARIAELQKIADAQPPTPPVLPEEPAPEPPPAPPPASPAPQPPSPVDVEPTSAHPGRPLVVAGMVTGGIGLAVAATGIVFLLKSRSIQSDLEEQNRQGVPWTQALKDKESDGQTDSTLGGIGIAVGAAAAITGATLWWMGSRAEAKAARLQVAPFASGGVRVDLTF